MMNTNEALKEVQKRCQAYEFCSASENYYAIGQYDLNASEPFCVSFGDNLFHGASFEECLALLDSDISSDEILFRKFA